MGKKNSHKNDLTRLVNEFVNTKDGHPIIDYFTNNSNLPGRRANIEMATAFSEVVEESSVDDIDTLWNFCEELIKITPIDAPTNDPNEILPFCGTKALGSIGVVTENYYPKIIAYLKDLSNDPRWRMREAVGMAIQKLLINNSQKLLDELEEWIVNDNWLEMRAVAAGIAHPRVLEKNNLGFFALQLHKDIFEAILNSTERKSDNFKILRKGLCYTLSVVTQAVPDEGFAYMKQLVTYNDRDINLIIRENLKKNRLKKNFPKKVTELTKTFS
ncbi:MAG: HEAT repeat domain-containing protein [Candidatus Heimdallarchaeota archaeon]|nr:MAG: HEAT repeat domain-containing protein [Candidatus Heimdallarchaeota archaeon]